MRSNDRIVEAKSMGNIHEMDLKKTKFRKINPELHIAPHENPDETGKKRTFEFLDVNHDERSDSKKCKKTITTEGEKEYRDAMTLKQCVLLMEVSESLYRVALKNDHTVEDISVTDVLIQSSLSYLSRLKEKTADFDETDRTDLVVACVLLACRFYGSDLGLSNMKTECFVEACANVDYDIDVKKLLKHELWAFKALDYALWIEFDVRNYQIPEIDIPLVPLHTGFLNLEKECLSLNMSWSVVTLFGTDDDLKKSKCKEVLMDGVLKKRIQILPSILGMKGPQVKKHVNRQFRESMSYVANLMCGDQRAFRVDERTFELTVFDSSSRQATCQKMRDHILFFTEKLGMSFAFNGELKEITPVSKCENIQTAAQKMRSFSEKKSNLTPQHTLCMILKNGPVLPKNAVILKLFADDYVKKVNKSEKNC